ncbi:hypothetical protein G6F56_005360 [Rhizopus delemar]|nr:hypothetical protein G6F56_005360 [Rhizopus delemar]
MSENTIKLIEDSNRVELNAYLKFKKRTFEEVANSESESSQSSISDWEIKRIKKIEYFSGPGEKKWVPNSWLILDDTNVTKLFLKFRDRNIQTVEKTGNTLDNDGVDISAITFEPASELDINVKAACLKFVSLAIKCSERSEDMFFERYLKPLIGEAVLKSCSKDFVCSGSDAPDSNVPSKKKADFMLGYKDRKREIFLFYVELKRPGKVSKYQVEDDFVKLCKHMKYSIDNQAAIGIESPVALGLWCEGFVCSLIKMTLVEEGVYMPVVVRKFRLPESEFELLSLPRAMECLNFVLEEVKSFPEKYNARTKKAAIKKYMKPSFISSY